MNTHRQPDPPPPARPRRVLHPALPAGFRARLAPAANDDHARGVAGIDAASTGAAVRASTLAGGLRLAVAVLGVLACAALCGAALTLVAALAVF